MLEVDSLSENQSQNYDLFFEQRKKKVVFVGYNDLILHIIMATLNDDKSSYKVLKLLLQFCCDIFFPYLTNRELGHLDSIITDLSLRKLYLQQAGRFYLTNKFQTLSELNWVMKRELIITKCHLDFDFEGII